jgi:hypothetical protein
MVFAERRGVGGWLGHLALAAGVQWRSRTWTSRLRCGYLLLQEILKDMLGYTVLAVLLLIVNHTRRNEDP